MLEAGSHWLSGYSKAGGGRVWAWNISLLLWLKLCLGFRVPLGITFQLPGGKDVGPHFKLSCRARLCPLVAVTRLEEKRCFRPLRPKRWCFLIACGFAVSFFDRPRPKDRFSSAGIPSMFWDFGSLHQKHRESAGPHGRVRRDGSDGWRSPVLRGDKTGGRVGLPRPPTIRCQSRRLVQNFLKGLRCSGTSVRSARGVVASFHHALSRQPYFTSLSLRRLRLRVAAQASRTSHSGCFCNSRPLRLLIPRCRLSLRSHVPFEVRTFPVARRVTTTLSAVDERGSL